MNMCKYSHTHTLLEILSPDYGFFLIWVGFVSSWFFSMYNISDKNKERALGENKDTIKL